MARAGLAWIAALLIAEPAIGAVKVYELSGDQSTLFPNESFYRTGVVSGSARIDESGAAPVLADLSVHVAFSEAIGGSSFALEWKWERDLGPAPGQTGTGSTTSSISWGPLTGWSQTGFIVCPSQCFFGDCDTPCINFLGVAGTSPPFPLKGSVLDPGTWTFTGDGSAFVAEGFEVGNLAGGISTEHLALSGALAPPIPILPLTGIAVLGAVLCWAGASRLRPSARGPDSRGR